MLRGAQTDGEPVSGKETSYMLSARQTKRIESGMHPRTATPTPRSHDTGPTGTREEEKEEVEETETETGMRYTSYMSSMSDDTAISDTR